MRTLAYYSSLALLFCLPWEDMILLSGLGTAARIIGVVTFAVWLVSVMVTGRLRPPAWFHIAAAVFVLWNAASVFWSIDVDRTMVRLWTYAQLIGLSYLLWDLYDRSEALRAGLQAYVLGACLAIGELVTNFVRDAEFSPGRYSLRGANPDDIGLIMALGIPFALYLAATGSRRSGASGLQVLNYAYVPLSLLGIILTGARSAMIAAAPGLLFGLIAVRPQKAWLKVSALALLIAAAVALRPLLPDASMERLASIGSELSSGDLGGRLVIWREGYAYFAEHPWVGSGSNTFRYVNYQGKVAHNTPLSIVTEVGLLGLLLFGSMMAAAFVGVGRFSRLDIGLWFTVLVVWMVGAGALTWEHKKHTWLFLSLLTVQGGLAMGREEEGPPEPRGSPALNADAEKT